MNVPLPSTGHRERKKQRTREKLIEAALRLFIERGYEATRIDDIVAEVDIVPRTFFRYFNSKDDALFGWLEDVREEVLATLQTRPRGEGIVFAITTAYVDLMRAHREQEGAARVLHQLAERSPDIEMRWLAFGRGMQEEIAQVLARRLPASAALVCEMIAAAVHAAFASTANQWFVDGGPRPMEDYWRATTSKVLKLLAEFDERYVLR